MKNIERFIKDAIEGGWKYPAATHVFEVGMPRCKHCGVERVVYDRKVSNRVIDEGSGGSSQTVEEKRYDMEGGPCDKNPVCPITEKVMLDPAAWQAVGKVRRWDGKVRNGQGGLDWPWLVNMHGLIDALADGKTIESYLSEI